MSMLRNRKGIADIVLMVVAALFSLGVWGPKLVASTGDVFNGGNKNQTKQVHKIKESSPVLYASGVDKEGKTIYKNAGTFNRSEESYNTEAVKPPETLMQKFLGLGAWLLLIGAVITALGAWPLVKMWVGKIKAKIAILQEKHDDLSYDAKKICEGIDLGLKEFDDAIETAKAKIAAAQGIVNAAAAMTDATARAATMATAQNAITENQAYVLKVTDLKKAFLAALSKTYDQSTKDTVKELLKNDETNLT